MLAAHDHMTQMPEQDRAATTAMPAQGGKQLQAEGLGMPADSQVISYQYLTRAKHSLAHITIDELEQNMPLPNEQLIPLEEGEEYENFLEVIKSTLQQCDSRYLIMLIYQAVAAHTIHVPVSIVC